MELIARFLIGGAMVTLFAAIGDAVQPKSFAGLLGAAPSVAFASLGLTLWIDGPAYAAVEARSMVIGGVAFFVYAWIASRTMWKTRIPARIVTLTGLLIWLGVALVGWFLLALRSA
jgi:ABC-type xylose transport system permease subunit